jgi:hypothetical protein
MKYLSLLVLILGMAGCAKPVSENDVRLIPLRTFAQQNHLLWHVAIYNDIYCVGLSDGTHTEAECGIWLGPQVRGVIKKWQHPIIPWPGIGEDMRPKKAGAQ